MADYTIEVLERAVFEMREIYLYIAQDNESAAKKLYDEIHARIAGLVDFPSMGTPVDKDDPIVTGYRYILVDPYLIFYKINGRKITVYHVLNGAMDYIRILKSQ